MAEVSIRELRNNLTKYIRRSEQGERVTVTRRGKAVATIEPIAEPESADDAWLWEMVRRGEATWSGRKFKPAMPTIRMRGEGPTLSEMIIEDRG